MLGKKQTERVGSSKRRLKSIVNYALKSKSLTNNTVSSTTACETRGKKTDLNKPHS